MDTERYKEERDLLAKAIGDAAIKTGIIGENIDLTGPMLAMLCDDLAEEVIRLRMPKKGYVTVTKLAYEALKKRVSESAS